jgi:hypothetical protein
VGDPFVISLPEHDPAQLDITLAGVPHPTGNGTTERGQHLADAGIGQWG